MKRIFCLLTALVFIIGIPAISSDASSVSAAEKISDELTQSLNENTTATAVVTMADVDHDVVMTLFAKQYPEEFNVYMWAKFGIGEVPNDESYDELLQSAIEHKRELYKQSYSASNQGTLSSYYSADDIVFISSYSPLAIVNTDHTSLLQLASNNNVISVSAISPDTVVSDSYIDPSIISYPEIINSLKLSNSISRADYVRDTLGNSGAGVKIGMIDATGIPDISKTFLSSSTINTRSGDTSVSDHATVMALIMVGQEEDGENLGVAPDATLYSCITPTEFTIYSGVEWLIDSGVNIINASISLVNTENEGEYSTLDAWIDHIAVQHDIHFVSVSGNFIEGRRTKVTSPGMAYNVITVGGLDANNSTDLLDLTVFSDSLYEEASDTGPQKPNLVANAVFSLFYENGTSYAAPQVTGVIAQLCSCSSALKVKQSAIGAILAASSARKIESIGSGEKGDSFETDSRIEGNPQISDVEGAGILDARWARHIVASGNYWTPIVYAENFPYTRTVTIDATANTVSRIAIFWLKRNEVTSHTANTSITEIPIGNLDLYVYDPYGVLIASSTIDSGNFEIIQFTPTVTGEYTVLINSNSIDKEYIGIALW